MWSERQRAMLQAMGLHLRLPAMEAEQPAVAAVTDGAAGSSPQTAHRAAGGVQPPREHASEHLTAGAPEHTAGVAGARQPGSDLPLRGAAVLPLTAQDSGVPADPAAAHAGSRPPPTGRPVSPAVDAPARARIGRTSEVAAAPVAQPMVLPAEIAALDWPALRHAVAACRACSLCETRKQTVFGVGHPQAQWMVVGEAPGAEEDARGEPFVGRAGQLLDAMLRALQLTRAAGDDLAEVADETPAQAVAQVAAEQRVYIANTLKCRPPGNRNPQPDELARCEPFLVRQIELLRPRLILAMGRFAVQALLRSTEPIGRLRGRVHRYQGVPLVVSYHPAYLLRNPADKGKAWDDLCLAAEVAAQGRVTDGPTTN